MTALDLVHEVCAEDFAQIQEWQRGQQPPTTAAIEANRLFHTLRLRPRCARCPPDDERTHGSR